MTWLMNWILKWWKNRGKCKHPCLVPLGSQRKKICVDCCTEFKWNLDTGQVSMYGDTSETTQRDYEETSGSSDTNPSLKS